MVSSDFKDSEVGVIPEDWNESELGEFCSFRTGPFGSAIHKSDYVWDGVPLVNPMHIIDGSVVPDTSMSVDPFKAKSLSDFTLRVGDIVIGRRGDMGRCAVISEREEGWLCGTGSMIIRPNAECDANFLQRILSSPQAIQMIEDASVGSTMINLNQGTLRTLKFQRPEIREQEAIAEALSDADGLIAGLEALIAKKRDLKTATMQQLLTGKTRLPGFGESRKTQQSELGDVPADWDLQNVGELFNVQLGKMLDAEKNTGVPKAYVGNRAVQWGRIDVSELSEVKLSSSDLRRFRLKQGDILVCEGGEVGRCAIWNSPIDECYYQKALHRLRPKSAYSTQLATAFFRYYAEIGLFDSYVTQTSIAHLPKEKFIEVPMPVPNPAEQEAIASVVLDFEGSISALQIQLQKATALKQGMMQELLTGRTRLI